LLGGINSAQAKRLGRVAKEYETPVITPAEITADSSEENLFSVNVSPVYKSQVLARFAAQELKVEYVAILLDNRLAIGSVLADAFQREFAEKNGKHTDQWNFKTEDELAELAGRLKKTQASAMLLVSQAGAIAKFETKLQGAGIRVPLLFAGDEE